MSIQLSYIAFPTLSQIHKYYRVVLDTRYTKNNNTDLYLHIVIFRMSSERLCAVFVSLAAE